MKPPQITPLDAALVDKAVSLWKSGELVAMPTETVYGLAADATNGMAVAKIYAAKARPQFNPLIVHVANIAAAERFVQFTSMAEQLAEVFWPGPLTLVLKRRAGCPISELVSAGGDTLAIRVPAHPAARQLLQAFGGGVAAPSANRSGRVSPTTAAHVAEELGGVIPLIIDGGACDVGVESTVVDCSGEQPRLLRPGSITRAMLERITGPLGQGDTPGHGPLLAPGQLASHYAPTTPVRLNATDVSVEEALLAFGPSPLTGAAQMLNLSLNGDLSEAAANLFAQLRALDAGGHAAIAVMPIPADGLGEAINDRLARAAVRD
ncbi:MAG: threonylcarbamoyl-AMP synthase [Azospirillum brasilense]|nr:MAG: threonylcarbamoyl-AMP synthase [Azospirillum brasilense]